MEFQDEILNGEAKYRISDDSGNILHEKVKIEMITEVLQAGTPLNKVLFDKIKSYLVPSGLISMWSGSVVPAGWYLCDGTNGTPDLRNRFIVGAGDEYEIGVTGGEKTHALSVSEMPSHTHEIKLWSDISTGSNFTGLVDGDGNEIKTDVNRYTGEHTYPTESIGGGEAHENRPPYYALAYIMKA